MAIQQLINLIMMQNCQFMNHQQVLLCWLQKLQFQLCASARSPACPPTNAYHHAPNNLAGNDATGDPSLSTTLLADSQLSDQLNGQQLNNSKLSTTLNNQAESSLIKNANNFYDNLKSHHNPSIYANQLSSGKPKNPPLPNFKLNKLKSSETHSLRAPKDMNDMYNMLKDLIERKQGATGKLNNYQSEFGEFDEPGAVGGIEELNELGDLADNLHANNLTASMTASMTNSLTASLAKQSASAGVNSANLNSNLSSNMNSNLNNNLTNNLNNPANHLISNGINNLNSINNIASTANTAVANASANKSPQMILNLPGSAAVRKKTTTGPVTGQRKNAPDVIESISCTDDLIKSHSSESIRPLMAAEGRSSEFNLNQPPTTMLQNQVAKSINGSTKISSTIGSAISSTISSTSAINGQNPIVAAAASSTNGANVLLKRPPTTGASRRNDFDDDNDTEETSDDDLANRNQATTPEAHSSENEANNAGTTNLPNSNQNGGLLESSTLDAEQVDGQLGFANAHLNGRNDSEIRLSGDGI